MVTLKLEKLEILFVGWVFSILQRQHSQTCTELTCPVLGSFEDVRFSTTLNIKVLAPDVINLIRIRRFNDRIARKPRSHSVSERHFVKQFSLSKPPIHPGNILFKFAGTFL